MSAGHELPSLPWTAPGVMVLLAGVVLAFGWPVRRWTRGQPRAPAGPAARGPHRRPGQGLAVLRRAADRLVRGPAARAGADPGRRAAPLAGGAGGGQRWSAPSPCGWSAGSSSAGAGSTARTTSSAARRKSSSAPVLAWRHGHLHQVRHLRLRRRAADWPRSGRPRWARTSTRSRPSSARSSSRPGWGGPSLWFAAVPEPKTAKNRMHFDLRAPGSVVARGRAARRCSAPRCCATATSSS